MLPPVSQLQLQPRHTTLAHNKGPNVIVFIYATRCHASVARAGARAVLQVVNSLEDLLLHARDVVLEGGVGGTGAVDGDLDVIVELLDGFNVGVVPAGR